MLSNRLGYFDTNNDNTLSRSEFQAFGASVARDAVRTDSLAVYHFVGPSDFERIDSNRDGKVTLEELTAAVARVHLSWHAVPANSSMDSVFTGTWTLQVGDAWSTVSDYMTPQEMAVERSLMVRGGTMFATFDATCILSLRLMTNSSQSADAQVFLDMSLICLP